MASNATKLPNSIAELVFMDICFISCDTHKSSWHRINEILLRLTFNIWKSDKIHDMDRTRVPGTVPKQIKYK